MPRPLKDGRLLVDGVPVGVAEYGDPDGLPVLALHGAPASRLMFVLAHEPAALNGLRFIAPDRPGYGLTPPDTNPSLATRALWLERVANAAGLERFAILGISGGAPYAVALASRIGSRALALALVSPMGPVADLVASGPEGKAQVPFLQRRFFLHLPRRWVFPPLARLLARAFAASPSGFSGLAPRLAGDPDAAILRKSHVREAMLAMTREAVRTGAEGGIADLGIYAAPWGVDFAAISAPARVWQGTADRIVPVAAAMRLAARIPGCTLERIEGAGHFWVFERMDEICRALKRMAVAAPPSQQSASRSAT